MVMPLEDDWPEQLPEIKDIQDKARVEIADALT